MRRTIICICMVLTAIVFPVFVQDNDTATAPVRWYVSEAEKAIDNENYEYAFSILSEAKKNYPHTPRFPMMLGDIFSERELYGLARDEYLLAYNMQPDDYEVLFELGSVNAYLNRNREAIGFLEKIRTLYPYDTSVISDLAWLYFKVHRLDDGIQLLLDALENDPDNEYYLHTLGTLYSGKYDYESSSYYYKRSIEVNKKKYSAGTNFQSIAYYNLSLLEEEFYNYYTAYTYAERSVSINERATGLMAKGEFYQMRLDFPMAYANYNKALALDDSSLSKLSLADYYVLTGQLREALAILKPLYEDDNLHWMRSFGTDPDRYYVNVHELLFEVYRGLAQIEKSTPRGNPIDTASGFLKQAQYETQAWYHGQMYHSLNVKVGNTFLESGKQLEGWASYYNANEDYPPIAKKYLRKVRDFELQYTEKGLPLFELEEGIITRDAEQLLQAINSLDPVWEKSDEAQALASLAKIYRRRGMKAQARSTLNRLYDINPGEFRKNGLGIPAVVSIQLENPGIFSFFFKNDIYGKLKKTGIEVCNIDDENVEYTLDIHIAANSLTYTFTDNGDILKTGTLGADKDRSAKGIVTTIVTDIYAVYQ